MNARRVARTTALSAAVLGPCACAPPPERDARVVRDLRILGIAVDRPISILATGPADDTHPLYTFAEEPLPGEVRVLVVDPRAPGDVRRVSARACLAAEEACRETAANTLVLATDTPVSGEDVVLPMSVTRAQLNAWLAEDPLHGYDRLYVRVEVEIRASSGEIVYGETVRRYSAPTFSRWPDGRRVDFREPLDNPVSLAVVPSRPEGAPALDALRDTTVAVGGERRVRYAFLDNSIFTDVTYTLPLGDEDHARRLLSSHATLLSVYSTVDGGLDVEPAAVEAVPGASFSVRLAEPFAAGGTPRLYLVASDSLGGCAWARWTFVTGP